MKRLLTIFLPAENIHLVKDVGMIPYILQKEMDYSCTLASYKNGDYPYLQKEVSGLKQRFIRRYTSVYIIDVLIFLIKTRKQYDILQLYHLEANTLMIGFLFKLLHLFKVKVHLKLDTGDVPERKKRAMVKKVIFRYLLLTFDLITVEALRLQKVLSEKWQLDIKYLPNGFFDYGKKRQVSFREKENVIITVGRIGIYDKATEILLEAFKEFSNLRTNWRLEVIGPVDASFNSYIDGYFNMNPALKEHVQFLGAITDREVLRSHYCKAKLFVLPSRSEGFPLVFLEAATAGCYIISTDISPAHDITKNGQLGSIFPINDTKKLSEILFEVTGDPERMERVCLNIQEYAYQRFYWPTLCRELDAFLNTA